MIPCLVDGCLKPAGLRKGGYCEAHAKRRLRGQVVAEPIGAPRGGHVLVTAESTWLLLTEAALAYADADSDDEVDFRRATDRLRKAALSYAGLVEPQPEPQRVRRRFSRRAALWLQLELFRASA